MIDHKIIGGVVAIVVVVAVIAVWFLVQGEAQGETPTTMLSTKDPADVVLKTSDLPAGYSTLGEVYFTPDNWKLNISYSTMEGWGYQTGLGRVFKNTSDPNKAAFSAAFRFSSAEGAENAYDVWVETLDNYGIGVPPPSIVVPHSTIGDQSLIKWISERNRHSGISKKQNFIVIFESYYFLDSEVINYLQIIAGRI